MDIVQARMINEVLYCERLMYLERVQGEFEHNYFTVDGNAAHRRADRPGGELAPLPSLEEDAEDRPYKARSVHLTSDTLGITAKIDIVESDNNGAATPIEYKRGHPPDIAEGAYLPERAQLCAQMLLLREHGYRVDKASIYFAAAKKRVEIIINDALIEVTLAATKRVRELTELGRLPPPLVDSPKCVGCSLIGICLPDEVNHLRGRQTAMRQLHPARDDKTPLHVQEQGAKIGLSGECLTVTVKGEKVAEAGLALTSQVSLYGAVQISTQALRECMGRNLPVSFFTTGGWYCGRSIGADSKNAELRVAQYRRVTDTDFALKTAKSLVSAKIKNCRTMLRRNADGPIGDALRTLDGHASRAEEVTSVESLLGIEGTAARTYFENFSKLIKGTAFDFEHRNRRPPKDPVNALLSLAYALLTKDFACALHAVSLDPLLGFYHQPRHGRPSLALDLMEEFRPLVADSVVITAINTGVVKDADFTRAAGAVALTSKARRDFIQAYERRMDSEVAHPVFGYKISYRRVLEVQSRLMSRYIMGEIDEYPQFITR